LFCLITILILIQQEILLGLSMKMGVSHQYAFADYDMKLNPGDSDYIERQVAANAPSGGSCQGGCEDRWNNSSPPYCGPQAKYLGTAYSRYSDGTPYSKKWGPRFGTPPNDYTCQAACIPRGCEIIAPTGGGTGGT